MEKLRRAKPIPLTTEQIGEFCDYANAHPELRETIPHKGSKVRLDDMRRFMRRQQEGSQIWQNDRYTVHDNGFCDCGEGWPPMQHLSIRRDDRSTNVDWRELQQIKNQICGPEREAVELYPAESRLVDAANQFHLWVLPEGVKFPFGFTTRVVNGMDVGGAVQRAFEEGE